MSHNLTEPRGNFASFLFKEHANVAFVLCKTAGHAIRECPQSSKGQALPRGVCCGYNATSVGARSFDLVAKANAQLAAQSSISRHNDETPCFAQTCDEIKEHFFKILFEVELITPTH